MNDNDSYHRPKRTVWCGLRPGNWRCFFSVALVLAFAMAAFPVRSGVDEASEYQLKALWLRNLAKSLEWPDSAFAHADAPLVIGVLGSDPFGNSLSDIISGDSSDGHPLVIRKLRRGASIDGCHIVFVCKSEASRFAPVVAAGRGKPVLLVGEFPRFAHGGGHLNFLVKGDSINIEFNAAAAIGCLLKIPSKIQRAGIAVTSR